MYNWETGKSICIFHYEFISAVTEESINNRESKFIMEYAYIYIYIYIYISGDSSVFLQLVPPALSQLQFPTRGPWTQSKSS